MAENMCRTATEMIVPPGHGAIVVSALPETGVEGVYYIVDGDTPSFYTWDGTQFVSVGGGGSEYRDAYIAIVERTTVGDTLVLPEGPTEIGVNALSSFDTYDPQLKHIIVPEGVTRIKHLAFDGVYYLETIDLPSTVNIITPTPFTNDDNLQSITIRATTPPMIYRGTFDGVAANVVFYVPAESVNAYKTANYWSDRAAYIQAIQ